MKRRTKALIISLASLSVLGLALAFIIFVSHVNDYRGVTCIDCARLSRFHKEQWYEVQEILYSASAAHEATVFSGQETFEELVEIVESWLPMSCSRCITNTALRHYPTIQTLGYPLN